MALKLFPPGSRKGYRFWYVRGTYNGKPVEVSTGATAKDAAEDFLVGLPAALRSPADIDRSKATFADAIDLYVAYRKPSKSDTRYIGRLRARLGHKRLAEFKTAVIVEAAADLYPAATNETKNRQAFVPAAAILHHAADNGLCDWLRIKKLPERKPAARLPSDNAERLLIANTDGLKKLLLTILFRQGWRITEALRLAADNIDRPARVFRFYISKTDQWVTLPMAPEVASLMPRKVVGRLFPWRLRGGVYKWLKPLRRKLGIRFTPHMARHLFATSKRAAGWDLADIKDAGGWRDLKSVERYGRADQGRLRALISGKKSGTGSPSG